MIGETYRVEIVIPEDADSERVGETVEVQVNEDDYVLAAARNQDVWLAADCQQGWCTTCAAQLLEGEGDQSDAKRYFESDDEEDMILPCTAKPRSDLMIGPSSTRRWANTVRRTTTRPGIEAALAIS